MGIDPTSSIFVSIFVMGEGKLCYCRCLGRDVSATRDKTMLHLAEVDHGGLSFARKRPKWLSIKSFGSR
jgi:hypothetical protein